MARSISVTDFFSSFVDPVLPPPVIDGVTDGVIDLIALDLGLTLRIPFFEGMKAGDPFIFALEGFDARPLLDEGRVTDDLQATIFVPPEKARLFADQQATLYYFYLEAPNPPSPKSFFDVALNNFPVVVDQAQGGGLSAEAVAGALTVRIQPWPTMGAGDVVSLYGDGRGEFGTVVRHVQVSADEVGKDLVVSLPAGIFLPYKGGEVHLYYSILSLGRETWGPRSVLRVEPEMGLWTVNGIGDPIVTWFTDVEVQEKMIFELPPYPSIQVGDQVLLSVFALPSVGGEAARITRAHYFQRHTVQPDNIDQPIRISLPVSNVAFRYDTFSFRAIVERGGEITLSTASPEFVLSWGEAHSAVRGRPNRAGLAK